MTLYAVMRDWRSWEDNQTSPRWMGDIIEADSKEDAVRHFEVDNLRADRVCEIAIEKVLVKKWVEEEV